MVDVSLRLELLQKMATGDGATPAHIASFGQEALDAFEVDTPEDLRRDLRRAAYLAPNFRSIEAIACALNVQDWPTDPPGSLASRRDTLLWEWANRAGAGRGPGSDRVAPTQSDYRTLIRLERRGASQIEVIQSVALRGLTDEDWQDEKYFTMNRYADVDVKGRTLGGNRAPIRRRPE